MISGAYAYFQTHQITYIKYVQCFLYVNYTSVKLFKKLKPGLLGAIQGPDTDLGRAFSKPASHPKSWKMLLLTDYLSFSNWSLCHLNKFYNHFADKNQTEN